MKTIYRFVLGMLYFVPWVSFADSISLKDGRVLIGQVESAEVREVHIKLSDNSRQLISVSEIKSIQFDLSPAFGSIPPPLSEPTTTVTAPQTMTLPAGTAIAIRTIDSITSKKADVNREYAASLDDPIVVDGVEVVPANANAFLRISDVHSGGIARHASLAISLIAVTINGRRVTIEVDKVDSSSGSKAKRTATGAVAGAAAGAAIGALAGGVFGAGVGAGVGAAGGGLAAALSAKGVEIARETRFTFKLMQPVALGDQRSLR